MSLRKTNSKLVLSFFSIFLILFLIDGYNSSSEAAGVAYKGANKCKGMQVEVSFVYDAAKSIISEFNSDQSCIKGKGGAMWEPTDTIKVQKDGSFNYEDKYGNFVKGTISPTGKASGDLFKGHFKMVCGDGEPSYFCTKWNASPAD